MQVKETVDGVGDVFEMDEAVGEVADGIVEEVCEATEAVDITVEEVWEANEVVGEVVEEVWEASEVVGEADEEGKAEKEHLTLGIVKAIGLKYTFGFEIERKVFAVGLLILKWRCFSFKEHFLFGALEQS